MNYDKFTAQTRFTGSSIMNLYLQRNCSKLNSIFLLRLLVIIDQVSIIIIFYECDERSRSSDFLLLI